MRPSGKPTKRCTYKKLARQGLLLWLAITLTIACNDAIEWTPRESREPVCNPWNNQTLALQDTLFRRSDSDDATSHETTNAVLGCLVVTKTLRGGQATQTKLVRMDTEGTVSLWNGSTFTTESLKLVQINSIPGQGAYRFQLYGLGATLKQLASANELKPNEDESAFLSLFEKQICSKFNEASYTQCLRDQTPLSCAFMLEFKPQSSKSNEDQLLATLSPATENANKTRGSANTCALYTPTSVPKESQLERPEPTRDEPPAPDTTPDRKTEPTEIDEPAPKDEPAPRDEPAIPDTAPDIATEKRPDTPPTTTCGFPSCSFTSSTPSSIAQISFSNVSVSHHGKYLSYCIELFKKCHIFQHDTNTDKYKNFTNRTPISATQARWTALRERLIVFGGSRPLRVGTPQEFLNNNALPFTHPSNTTNWNDARMSPDERRLYGLIKKAQSKWIHVWRFTQSGTLDGDIKVPVTFGVSEQTPTVMAVHPSKREVAISSYISKQWSIAVYQEDASSGAYSRNQNIHLPFSPTVMSYHPSGRWLIFGFDNGTLYAHAIPVVGGTLSVLLTPSSPAQSGPIRKLHFNRNGELMLTINEHTADPKKRDVRLWRFIPTAKAPQSPFVQEGFFPNGNSPAPVDWQDAAFGTTCNDVIAFEKSLTTASLQHWRCTP